MKRNHRIAGRYIGAFVVAFSGVLATPWWAQCQVPVYRGEPSGEYFRTWLLCGPFPVREISDEESELVHIPGFETDFLAAHGGENDPSIVEGQVEPFEGGSAAWFRYTSGQDAVSLDKAVSEDPFMVAYGYCARVAEDAVDSARDEGLKAGLLRPITLWPFPNQAIRDRAAQGCKFLVVEDSLGQMVDDVRYAIEGKAEVHLADITFRHLQSEDGVIMPGRVLEEIRRLL